MNQEEVVTVSKKVEENEILHAAKIEELQQVIAKLNAEKTSLSNELTSQLSQKKIVSESYQQSIDYKTEIEELIKSKDVLSLRCNDFMCETENLKHDLEKAKREIVSLADKNVDLATEIEKVRKDYAASADTNREKIESQKSEIDQLVATNSKNHQRIEELQKECDAKSKDTCSKDKYMKLEADLQIALSDLESKMQECREAQEANKQCMTDNRILSAKLTKLRELSAAQEERWQAERLQLEKRSDNLIKENRFELEAKLIKMKEKMVSLLFLYISEMCSLSFVLSFH